MKSQNLLIDADDTLWENNIYFERAIAAFISFLNHHSYSAEQVREALNDVERECILSHGYGLHSFTHALVQTFDRLAPDRLTPVAHREIRNFAQAIADQPIETLPEVMDTLQHLAARHRLILVTKGDVNEQSGKLAKSGLAKFFSAVEIVAEKSADAYREIISGHSLLPADTWMIGNSPKSDINPALSAGLNAVFVPHGNTWILEHEEVNPPQPPRQLLIVESFAALRDRF